MRKWVLAPLVTYHRMSKAELRIIFLILLPVLLFLMGFLAAEGTVLVKAGAGGFLGVWLLYSVSWIWNAE